MTRFALRSNTDLGIRLISLTDFFGFLYEAKHPSEAENGLGFMQTPAFVQLVLFPFRRTQNASL